MKFAGEALADVARRAVRDAASKGIRRESCREQTVGTEIGMLVKRFQSTE